MEALLGHGFEVPAGWMDPSGPRDATILYRRPGQPLQAVVWDEESGARTGIFVAGRQGERTRLGNPSHLGGGLLPAPMETAKRLVLGVREPQVKYRSHADFRDGADDRIRIFN
ncbi:hypothetical protein DPM19_11800 [Actinomadura craniellae]|uniref:Uncharacterized protein n=1 Tax=Actinomadura craniellae TaxID=2231787 RepID=A0A365H8D7_9ACTN|nr:hypothetical protein DPM19_11800 [Actinomadura craniellae]